MKEATHVGELLSGYLDAALDRRERERVESHLENCERCRADLHTLRALQIDLRAAAPPDPPPGYWERFAARVEAELPERQPTGAMAWVARVAEWFLPSGHLAWTRAIGAVATITIVTFVAIRGFRHEDVAMQAPETLGSSRAAPPVRSEPSRSVSSDVGHEAQPPTEPQFQGISGSPSHSARWPAVIEPPSDEVRAKHELEKSTPAEPKQKRLFERDAGEKGRVDAADEKKVGSTTEAPSAAPAPPPPASPGAEANRMAAPRSAPTSPDAAPRAAPASPEVAPQAREAGRMMQFDRAEPAAPEASLENAGVLRFVQAALASDTGAARAACDAFQKLGSAADVDHMRSWLGRVEPAPQGQELRLRSQRYMLSNQSADPAVAQLLDLDALVWPRRADGSFGAVVADLAGRFEAHAAAGAESRGRAIAYLDWLAAQAPDAASRDLWHERAEKLRD